MKLKTLAFAAALVATSAAQAQGAKLKVGLMLPATGTYAALGTAIENGFKLYVGEQGGKLGGREIEAIRCPLLAIQGLDDEYGTLEQIRGIARHVPQARLLELRDCRHSPHRDQPEAVIEAVAGFMELL